MAPKRAAANIQRLTEAEANQAGAACARRGGAASSSHGGGIDISDRRRRYRRLSFE